MVGSASQLEWLPDQAPSPWRPRVSWRERQFARLDLFIHRHAGFYLAGMMTSLGLGSMLVVIGSIFAKQGRPLVTCVTVCAAGAGILAVAISILIWRNRRESGRPASAAMIAALRGLTPSQRWQMVAEQAAVHHRGSPRKPATLSDILLWLDIAITAEQRQLPPTMAEAALVRDQARAFE